MDSLVDYVKFVHPFTCMISGPTSSGKTWLTRRLLSRFNTLISFNYDTEIVILRVLWAYGQMQSLYTKQISPDVEVQYFKGLPSEEEIQEINPHIIVIDDLMTELGNNEKFASVFTKGSHHMNISVIFISQNMYHQGKVMRTVGVNCHYYIVMKSLRAISQLMHFGRTTFPKNGKYLIDAYEDAVSKSGFSYIRIDLTQSTPDKYRITTGLTAEEGQRDYNTDFAPVFYIPRNV